MDFSKIYLFKNMKDEECLEMMECFDAKERKFEKGERLYDFSLLKNSVAILIKGKALVVREDIDGNRVILECLDENSVFGEVLIFSRISNDNIYVVCEEDCECIFIDYNQITKRCQNACYHHTQLVENLFDLMSYKALLLSERVEVLSRRSIRNKLICYFSILAADNGNNKVKIPFSITALAEYLCVDRSAMVRELGNMKNDGLIKMTDRRVVELLQ